MKCKAEECIHSKEVLNLTWTYCKHLCVGMDHLLVKTWDRGTKLGISEGPSPLLIFPLSVDWEEKVTISRSP